MRHLHRHIALVVIASLLSLPARCLVAVDSPAGGTPKPNGTPRPLNGTGCTCEDVTETITKEPPATVPPANGNPGKPGATTPDCGDVAGSAINQNVPIAPGAVNAGGASFGGVWTVKVNGTKDDCCKAVTVGLIQNDLSWDAVATYSNGGTLTGASSCAQNPINQPILDGAPQGHPLHVPAPFVDKNSVGKVAKCGDEVTLTFTDTPNFQVPLFVRAANGNVVRLVKVRVTENFKTWVVATCPPGFDVLRSYTWQTTRNLDVAVGNNGNLVITGKRCASETAARGGAGSAGPTVTAAPYANDCWDRIARGGGL